MRKVMVVLAGCLVVAVAAVKFGGALWAEGEAKPAATTMLFDFEEAGVLALFEATNSETAISTEHATSGKQSLKLTLKLAEESSRIYTERFPTKDWSGANVLKFDVFAEEAVTLAMTIKDPNSTNYATRFNRDEVALNKGANTVKIDLVDVGDKIDLKKVKSMTLFTRVTKDIVLYVDNVRLEK